MSTGAILGIAAVVLVVLFGVIAITTTRSRDRATAIGALSRETRKRDRDRVRAEQATKPEVGAPGSGLARVEGGTLVATKPAPPAVREPLDPEAYGVTRRQFLNRSVVATFAGGLSVFGVVVLPFLWPQLSGGFGARIRAGSLSDILSRIADSREPFYVPEGRFYLVPYPESGLAKAREVYPASVVDGMESGIASIYQKCVHLGCRVPWCKSAQWFECPCHGSQYNRVGEQKAGPAPRGLDRFPATVQGGIVVVDTGQLIQGPPIGTNTTGQEAEGPHCT